MKHKKEIKLQSGARPDHGAKYLQSDFFHIHLWSIDSRKTSIIPLSDRIIL